MDVVREADGLEYLLDWFIHFFVLVNKMQIIVIVLQVSFIGLWNLFVKFCTARSWGERRKCLMFSPSFPSDHYNAGRGVEIKNTTREGATRFFQELLWRINWHIHTFWLSLSFSHPLKVKLETINIYHTVFLREWCDKDSFETTYAFLIVTAQQAFFPCTYSILPIAIYSRFLCQQL